MDFIFDDAAFYATIEARRQVEGLSWRQLGRALDLSPSTFSRLARGRRPDVETFLRLLSWLNLPAESFMTATNPQAASNQDTLQVVSAALRQDRKILSHEATALEQLFRLAYSRLTSSGEKSDSSVVRARNG